jgi:hypothetical protein
LKLVECGLSFDCWVLARSFNGNVCFASFQRASCKSSSSWIIFILTSQSVAPHPSWMGVYSVRIGIFSCLSSGAWHPDSSGQARITSFAAQSNAQTFDFQVSVHSKYLSYCCNCIG